MPFSRFFTPTPAFWEWLEEKAQGRTIVDIGCGRGDLVRECQQRGFKVIGIDPCYTLFDVLVPADLSNAILPMGVEECLDFIGGDDLLLLCCRPCHDGFPIHVVETRRQSPFYYVGFYKNLERDIGPETDWKQEYLSHPDPTLQVHDPDGGEYAYAGEENEEIFEVARF